MTIEKPARRAPRLRAEDWIEAARQAIVQHGVTAVAVEPLAQRLGVTKGSFYWHFPNRDALLEATLERWAHVDTEAAIAELDRIADPRERLRQLIVRALTDDDAGESEDASASGFGHAFQLALGDAADDSLVQPVLRRVSERRVDYLIACFRAIGLPPPEACDRALLAYAVYVGTLRLAREAPDRVPRGEGAAAYRAHLVATLIPDEGDGVMGDG